MVQNARRREKGEGSIWYNEDKKRWYAQLSLGYDEYGKKVRKTVSAHNKNDVILKMRELIREDHAFAEVRNRHPLAPVRIECRNPILLKDYIKTYLNVYKRPVVTSRTFEWCVNMSK
jgi:hypothetical protein